MSLQAIDCFTIRCDECGVNFFEDTEHIGYSDRDSALFMFDESYSSTEWSVSPDGAQHRCGDHNRFCERCGNDAGPLSGERDFMCPACWAATETST